MDKEHARRKLFSRLRDLSKEERATRSSAIREWLAADPEFQRSETVFSFLNLAGEPRLDPLVAAFPDKRWAFSRVTGDDRIVFHRMERLDEAVRGPSGIREPDPMRHPEVSRSNADLLLIPGVGFDPSTRSRIGRGKGHYDRYLHGLGAEASLIGVAFSIQFITLATEAHDIPMTRLVSETGWV